MTNNELFWQLLEKEYDRAHMFCRKLQNHREKGDDLFQDALTQGLAKFPQLKDRSSFMPWLYQIILNKFKSTYRKDKLRSFLPLSESETYSTATDQKEVLIRRKLDQLLGTLSSKERSLVVLYELEGWSLTELSNLFAQSENNIRVKLSRCRTKMKNSLQDILKDKQKNTDWSKLLGEMYAL